MKLATGELIAESLDNELGPKHVIPDSLDRDVPVKVSDGLAKFK